MSRSGTLVYRSGFLAFRLGFLVLALCLVAQSFSAQGFDWQYSARVPFESPILFYGLEVSSGYGTHFASLDYLEKGTSYTCCTYDRGSGMPFGAMIAADYWLLPEVSVQAGIGMAMRSVTFTSDPQSFPRVDHSTVTVVTSEYVFTGTITYATLQGALRYRILGTHLNIGGGLKLMVKLGETQTQIDRVISPDNYFFNGNPPSKEKDLKPTILDDASVFVLEPFASVGYDLTIRRGMYLTPTITIGGPITSLSKTQPWRALDLGVGIRLMNAF
ncbi:MAG: hypothetical protein SGJ05_07355 [bacterium]|nr:hypothetical protein [bacterium]